MERPQVLANQSWLFQLCRRASRHAPFAEPFRHKKRSVLGRASGAMARVRASAPPTALASRH
jgi:hypothetical protein